MQKNQKTCNFLSELLFHLTHKNILKPKFSGLGGLREFRLYIYIYQHFPKNIYFNKKSSKIYFKKIIKNDDLFDLLNLLPEFSTAQRMLCGRELGCSACAFWSDFEQHHLCIMRNEKSQVKIKNRTSKIENRKSKIENRTSNIENEKSKIKNQKSKIENRKSKIKNRKSKIENEKSKMKNEKSKMKNRTSNIE